MQGLFVLYSALAVFGIGVTIVDLFGVFEHAGQPDGGHDDGSASDDDGDSSDSDEGTPGDHELDVPAHPAPAEHDDDGRGSKLSSADSGTRFVARTIGALRTGVYFSLGAGPTGLFALLTGVKSAESFAWSAGAGLFIAVLARSLRSFIRKDLDSTIKVAELIMDEATITVSVLPGAMGKAAVRRYGRETEVFVRAKDSEKPFYKGSKVRIVDFDDECCWIDVP